MHLYNTQSGGGNTSPTNIRIMADRSKPMHLPNYRKHFERELDEMKAYIDTADTILPLCPPLFTIYKQSELVKVIGNYITRTKRLTMANMKASKADERFTLVDAVQAVCVCIPNNVEISIPAVKAVIKDYYNNKHKKLCRRQPQSMR